MVNMKKFKDDILTIINDLQNIEIGVFSENTGNGIDGSAMNHAQRIKESFIDLILKIENHPEGIVKKAERHF